MESPTINNHKLSVSSPTPTITPSSSSGSITSQGEGQFGTYHLGDIPKVEAIFFASFHNTRGTVLKHMVFANELDEQRKAIYSLDEFEPRFNAISGVLIPKQELLNRLVKVNFHDIKIMGHPISLDHESYGRTKFRFNMCFVVGKDSKVDCMYEPLVQKLAEYLVELEQQTRFLSLEWELENKDCKLPDIMQDILNQLNVHGECIKSINDLNGQTLTTIYLKLCPSYRGIEPPKVAFYMVPMLTRVFDVSINSPLVEKMDVLSQKIITKIDGIRCVKEIAAEVSIDADLVARCIRNLYFYECVSLVPLFLYQNCYVSTEKLHLFYNIDKLKECQKFVKLRFNDSDDGPLPKLTDIFRLYMSLTCEHTMKSWCAKMNPRQYHVDERRLVQYGMYHKFVRKLSIFPVTTVSPDNELEFTRIHTLCDGTNAVEDLAVLYSVPPDQLLLYLQNNGKFEFISK